MSPPEEIRQEDLAVHLHRTFNSMFPSWSSFLRPMLLIVSLLGTLAALRKYHDPLIRLSGLTLSEALRVLSSTFHGAYVGLLSPPLVCSLRPLSSERPTEKVQLVSGSLPSSELCVVPSLRDLSQEHNPEPQCTGDKLQLRLQAANEVDRL